MSTARWLVGGLCSLATLAACGTPALPPVPSPQAPEQAAAEARAIYFVMVDRFHNGDPSNDVAIDLSDPQAFHGGDIAGISAKLDHIQQLGFTDVWLTPVFEMRTDKLDKWGAFHGYWVNDPTRVEPRFGTEAELVALSEALHSRGMKLWLDVVWNHVGFDSPLIEEHPDWFHAKNDITDWSDPVQVTENEVHGLPDLAQEKPEVLDWLFHSHEHWLSTVHPDGFRVDAVRHMRPGPQRELAERLREVDPSLELLGEVFDGDPAALAPIWAATGYDRVFDFPLHYAMLDAFCRGQGAGPLATVLDQDRGYANPTKLVTFLDNHDTPRVLHECAGNVDAVARALDFQLSVRGTPSMTWGTEVGHAGAGEPDNRADMRFVPHPLREVVQDGLARRAADPALHAGRTEIVDLQGQLLVLAQRHPAGDRLVTVNLTGAERAWRGQLLAPGVAVRADIPTPAPFSGEREVHVLTDGDRLAGVGPALGQWRPAHGPEVSEGRASLTAEVGSVLTFKVVHAAGEGWRWPEGANNVVFVAPGAGPLTLDLRPR